MLLACNQTFKQTNKNSRIIYFHQLYQNFEVGHQNVTHSLSIFLSALCTRSVLEGLTSRAQHWRCADAASPPCPVAPDAQSVKRDHDVHFVLRVPRPSLQCSSSISPGDLSKLAHWWNLRIPTITVNIHACAVLCCFFFNFFFLHCKFQLVYELWWSKW